MTDTTNFKYTVDGFDKDHMVLFVTLLDDNRKVNIGVTALPTTQAELDAVVKPFAAPAELAATLNTTTKDTSFIEGVVSKIQKTSRQSAVAPVDTSDIGNANDLVVGNATVQDFRTNMKQADVAYIKSLIKEVLAEQTTTS